MSDKESPQENQSASPIGEIEHGPSGLDAFLDANQKKLMVIATLLVIGVVAYVVITGLQQSAREKAAAEISAAHDLPALRALHEDLAIVGDLAVNETVVTSEEAIQLAWLVELDPCRSSSRSRLDQLPTLCEVVSRPRH